MSSDRKPTSKNKQEAHEMPVVVQNEASSSAVTVSQESESTELLFRNSRSFTTNPPGTAVGNSSGSESENEGGRMSRVASGTLCSSDQQNNNLCHGAQARLPTATNSGQTLGCPLGSTHARTTLLSPSKTSHSGNPN